MAKRSTKKSGYWMMKRHKGRGRIDTRRAPDWWLSRPDEVEAYLRSLKGVEVFEVARSPGGRPVIAAAWGEREDLPGRTSRSLASATAGGAVDAFYGQGTRERQGFTFVGAAHATEFEGTVAALNFLNVVVTGKDLRGRRWPRMAAEGRKLRIVIIPFLNIDGRERYREIRHFIGVDGDAYQRITQGTWKDGERIVYPRSKRYWPMPPDQVGEMGSYYNDAGYNLVYDAGFGDDCQPETRGLVRLLKEEMPDCVLCSHTNNGNLVQQTSCFVPDHYRFHTAEMGACVGTRCFREGMKKFGLPRLFYPFTFYQTDMIFHVCGALPFIVEFPCGWQSIPDNHDEVLDICMYALEEIVAFGTLYGFRPREPI